MGTLIVRIIYRPFNPLEILNVEFNHLDSEESFRRLTAGVRVLRAGWGTPPMWKMKRCIKLLEMTQTPQCRVHALLGNGRARLAV
jgi:hypothetical protein